MAGMTEARLALTEALQGTGYVVKDSIPAKVVPPLVILSTGAPMLDNEVSTFNGIQYDFHLVLFVVSGTKPTPDALAGLEEMVETIILNLGDWSVEEVGPPEFRSANDQNYLNVAISITNTITIEGGNE